MVKLLILLFNFTVALQPPSSSITPDKKDKKVIDTTYQNFPEWKTIHEPQADKHDEDQTVDHTNLWAIITGGVVGVTLLYLALRWWVAKGVTNEQLLDPISTHTAESSRTFKLTGYRDWWPALILRFLWVVFLLGAFVFSFLYGGDVFFSNKHANEPYILTCYIVALVIVIWAMLSTSVRGVERFFMRTCDLNEATHLYVAEVQTTKEESNERYLYHEYSVINTSVGQGDKVNQRVFKNPLPGMNMQNSEEPGRGIGNMIWGRTFRLAATDWDLVVSQLVPVRHDRSPAINIVKQLAGFGRGAAGKWLDTNDPSCFDGEDALRYFEYAGVRYVWCPHEEMFRVSDFEMQTMKGDLFLRYKLGGMMQEEADHRRGCTGGNVIIAPKYSRMAIFHKIASLPLLALMVALQVAPKQHTYLWISSYYTNEVSFQIILNRLLDLIRIGVTYFMVWSVFSRRARIRHELTLPKGRDQRIQVFRDNVWQWIDNQNLVPGDFLKLRAGYEVPCDALVMSKQGIVVDEVSLTGEPYPVKKMMTHCGGWAIDEIRSSCSLHPSTCLFSGTRVVSIPRDGDPVGMVIRVGALSTKGQLERMILESRDPNKFQLDDQFDWYLVSAFAVRAVIVIFEWIFVKNVLLVDSLFYEAQFIGVILLAWLLVREYYVRRLSDAGVKCLETRSLPLAGAADCFMLDKTGTVTSDVMDFCMLKPANEGRFGAAVECTGENKIWMSKIREVWRIGLGVAHNCAFEELEGDAESDKIIGESVDTSMLSRSGWTMTRQTNDRNKIKYLPCPGFSMPEVELIRTLDFDNTTMTSGAVVKYDDAYHIFVKGAVSSVIAMCGHENGSIPSMTKDTAEKYSRQRSKEGLLKMRKNGCPKMFFFLFFLQIVIESEFLFFVFAIKFEISFLVPKFCFLICRYYVLAMAYRKVNIEDIVDVESTPRGILECDLEFMGFLLFRNELKMDAVEVIESLHKQNVRTLLATGDDVWAGLAVARKVGIIKSNDAGVRIFLGDVVDDKDTNQSKLKWIDADSYMEFPEENVFKAALSKNNTQIVLTSIAFRHLQHHPSMPDLMPLVRVMGRMEAEDKVDAVLKKIQEIEKKCENNVNLTFCDGKN